MYTLLKGLRALTSWALKTNNKNKFHLYSFLFYIKTLLRFKKIVSTINIFHIHFSYIILGKSSFADFSHHTQFTRKTVYVSVAKNNQIKAKKPMNLPFCRLPSLSSLSTLLLNPVRAQNQAKKPKTTSDFQDGSLHFTEMTKTTWTESLRTKMLVREVEKFHFIFKRILFKVTL